MYLVYEKEPYESPQSLGVFTKLELALSKAPKAESYDPEPMTLSDEALKRLEEGKIIVLDYNEKDVSTFLIKLPDNEMKNVIL